MTAHSRDLKGRPPPRQVPSDFDVIFVEQGREACVTWYRAHKRMITRWLEERGKERLIKARAAYVKHQRKNGKWLTRSSSLVEIRKARPKRIEAVRDQRRVSLTVARHAAQHLRIIRHGGFIVSMASNGDWRVGTRLMSAAQLVDFAVGKGFDRYSIIDDEGQQPIRIVGGTDAARFPCGHARTSGNIRRKADGRERCRECNRRYNLASIRRVRARCRRAALQAAHGAEVD